MLYIKPQPHCYICKRLFLDNEHAYNIGQAFNWQRQELCCIPCKEKHEDDINGFYRGTEAYFWEMIQDNL